MTAGTPSTKDLTGFVYRSHEAALQLSRVSYQARNEVLLALADALKQRRNEILEANTLDLEASREMSVPDLVLEWLKLTPERWQNAIEALRHLAAMPDPLARRSDRSGYRRVPLGAIAFACEGFPQLGAIAAGMCLKTANSLILKPGNESMRSFTAIAAAIAEVLSRSSLPDGCVTLPPEGSSLKDLISQEKYLRLLIPYGRPSFVQQVCKQSTVAVLPTAMGNCHLYLAPSGNPDLALEIVKTSRIGDPDAVNAIEKILLHRQWLATDLVPWLKGLQRLGLEVRGCDAIVGYCCHRAGELMPGIVPETQWGQPCFERAIAIKVVNSLEEAIAWIDRHSSGHADAILTDSLQESQAFARYVGSSSVYINAPCQFKRIDTTPDGGVNVALGMSSMKLRGMSRYPGPIDLYALTSARRIVTAGNGF